MSDVYAKIYSWENLRLAHQKAARGKRGKRAAAAFEYNLADRLLTLQQELLTRTLSSFPNSVRERHCHRNSVSIGEQKVVRAELNRLAFEAHRDQPQLVGTADIAQERLVSALLTVAANPEVNPVRLVEYMRDRAGLLAARGEGVYTFPHRTFQEYLAACHLTDYGFLDELARLLKAPVGRPLYCLPTTLKSASEPPYPLDSRPLL